MHKTEQFRWKCAGLQGCGKTGTSHTFKSPAPRNRGAVATEGEPWPLKCPRCGKRHCFEKIPWPEPEELEAEPPGACWECGILYSEHEDLCRKYERVLRRLLYLEKKVRGQ